jgi:prepilin-type N-terminal cleavage/methylation domain-containing protein
VKVLALRTQRCRPGARGLTLLEMMIVISILGIVTAMAVPNLTPVINNQRLAGQADEVAGMLDRARRLAEATGRCHRVRLLDGNLRLEPRLDSNCVNGIGTASRWGVARGVVRPTPGVQFTLASLGHGNPWVIYRPNGRIRGNNDHIITDDGVRVNVISTALDRYVSVFGTSSGRVCARSGLGAAPAAMPATITCGGL